MTGKDAERPRLHSHAERGNEGMGTNRVAAAQALFSENRIPHFVSPETAITAFSFLARHLRNQRFLMQFPLPMSDQEPSDPTGARLIIQDIPSMNRDALTAILLRVSELVCEVPEIVSLEINPLIGNDQEVIAVDARIQVDYVPPQQRTYGHMAIHPYPVNLIERVPLPDARRRGFRIMEGEVLAVNTRILALMRSLGFRSKASPEAPAIKLVTKML